MSKKTTKKTAETTQETAEGQIEVANQLLAELAELELAKKTQDKETKERNKKVARLTALRDGTVHEKHNPKGRHNPQLLPETLRKAADGELINGLPAKGWVVTIMCEICGVEREINTQDAFQVRYCAEHKAQATADAAKARRESKKQAELAELSPTEIQAKIDELRAELAA